MLDPILLLSLLTSGLLVGNELAVALFIHPVLYSVPGESHARVAKPLAGSLGRYMPFWYAASLVLAILQLFAIGMGSEPVATGLDEHAPSLGPLPSGPCFLFDGRAGFVDLIGSRQIAYLSSKSAVFLTCLPAESAAVTSS